MTSLSAGEERRAAMEASCEHWKNLEAVAACLREEGLKAVTQKHITLLPTHIGIVRKKERKGLFGAKFDTFENTHTIFLTDGDIVIIKGLELTGDADPLARIPLADPECFQKVKEVIRKNP